MRKRGGYMKNKNFIVSSVEEQRTKIKRMYDNKYYNLFMHHFKWNGLEFEQSDYIMKQFWALGTVAAFKIKHTDELGFCPYTVQKWNYNDFPEQVMLVNKWNVPFIPYTPQTVNEDVVIGWIQANHQGIRMIVDSYVSRMVAVDMVINTNLFAHKMPVLIGITPEDIKKAQDVIMRIENDEPSIFMDAGKINSLKALVNGSPYIIDKLYSYRTSLENELLTYLGMDNASFEANKERSLVDEVNANNAVINANQECMLWNLEKFAERINEVFGTNISVEPTVKPVESVYDKNNETTSEGGDDNETDNG